MTRQRPDRSQSPQPEPSRGIVSAADAAIVRAEVNAALGLPILDHSWLQPSGEVDGEGAPILVEAWGGTTSWRDVDPETGEYEIDAFAAALVEQHGSARAKAAVRAALERPATTPPAEVPAANPRGR